MTASLSPSAGDPPSSTVGAAIAQSGQGGDQSHHRGGEVRYSTVVTRVGPLVPDFLAQGVLILFGAQAPEELHDFCALHRPDTETGGLRVGDLVTIDDATFTVTAIGEVAETNLLTLGHLDLKANGASSAPLPGDVCVEAAALPAVTPGTSIRITAPASGTTTGSAAGSTTGTPSDRSSS